MKELVVMALVLAGCGYFGAKFYLHYRVSSGLMTCCSWRLRSSTFNTKEFLAGNSTFVLTAKPSEPVSLSQIDLYKPSDVPALLNLSGETL